MPIGGGLSAEVALRIRAEALGMEQSAARIRGLTGAVQQNIHTTNKAGAANVRMGRSAQQGNIMYSRAMQGAAQSSFRFTFYALMAMRAGQALISAVFVKGMSQAATKFETAFGKIRGILQATAEDFKALERTATAVAMATPFGPTDVAQAMRTGAKAGLTSQQIQAMILPASILATRGDMEVSESMDLLTVTLNAYNLAADRAADTTKYLGLAATNSRYEVAGLKEALAAIGPTAAGYGQNLQTTLQMITALGKVGAPVSEAGTMIRQGLMRSAVPEVQEFFQFMTEEYNSMTRAALSEQGLSPDDIANQLISPLYNEQGYMSNLGETMIAVASVIKQKQAEAEAQGRGAEFGQARDALFYELFGIKQAKWFLAMGTYGATDKGLQAYRDLYPILDDATRAQYQYMEAQKKTFGWTQIQAKATGEALAKTLGQPMNMIMRPFIQAGTEITAFINKLMNMNDTVKAMVPAFMFLSGAAVIAAGSIALIGGVAMLIMTRLGDVGSQLIASGAAAKRLGASAIAGVAPWRVAFKHFGAIALGPLKIIMALAAAGGILYYAWKNNLGGLQTATKPIFAWWQKKLNETSELAGDMADKIRKAFQSTHRTKEGWMVKGTPLGDFVAGIKIGVDTTLGAAIFVLVRAFKTLGLIMKYTVIPVVKFLVTVFSGFFKGFALIVGLGNMEKGFKRLGHVISVFLALKIFDVFYIKMKLLGMGLMKLFTFLSIIGPAGGIGGASAAIKHATFGGLISLLRAGSLVRGGGVAGAVKMAAGAPVHALGTATAWAAGAMGQDLKKGVGKALSRPRGILEQARKYPTRFVPMGWNPARQAAASGQTIKAWTFALGAHAKDLSMRLWGVMKAGLVGFKATVMGLKTAMVGLGTVFKTQGVVKGISATSGMFAAGGASAGMTAALKSGATPAMLFLKGLGIWSLIILAVSAIGYGIYRTVTGIQKNRASAHATSLKMTPSYLEYMPSSTSYAPTTQASHVSAGNNVPVTINLSLPPGTEQEQGERIAQIAAHETQRILRHNKNIAEEEATRTNLPAEAV